SGNALNSKAGDSYEELPPFVMNCDTTPWLCRDRGTDSHHLDYMYWYYMIYLPGGGEPIEPNKRTNPTTPGGGSGSGSGNTPQQEKKPYNMQECEEMANYISKVSSHIQQQLDGFGYANSLDHSM